MSDQLLKNKQQYDFKKDIDVLKIRLLMSEHFKSPQSHNSSLSYRHEIIEPIVMPKKFDFVSQKNLVSYFQQWKNSTHYPSEHQYSFDSWLQIFCNDYYKMNIEEREKIEEIWTKTKTQSKSKIQTLATKSYRLGEDMLGRFSSLLTSMIKASDVFLSNLFHYISPFKTDLESLSLDRTNNPRASNDYIPVAEAQYIETSIPVAQAYVTPDRIHHNLLPQARLIPKAEAVRSR